MGSLPTFLPLLRFGFVTRSCLFFNLRRSAHPLFFKSFARQSRSDSRLVFCYPVTMLFKSITAVLLSLALAGSTVALPIPTPAERSLQRREFPALA